MQSKSTKRPSRGSTNLYWQCLMRRWSSFKESRGKSPNHCAEKDVVKFNKKDDIKEMFHVLVNYYEKALNDSVDLKRLQIRTERWHVNQDSTFKWSTHPSILALEPILAQKSCSPKSWHQFQLIWPLFRIFFPKITKKLAKIGNLSKNC